MVDPKLVDDVEDMVSVRLRYAEPCLIHREDVLGINSHSEGEYVIPVLAGRVMYNIPTGVVSVLCSSWVDYILI